MWGKGSWGCIFGEGKLGVKKEILFFYIMKNNICIILIGAATYLNTKDNQRKGGQLSNYENLLNTNITVVSIDPQHKFESTDFIEKRVKIPVYRSIMRPKKQTDFEVGFLNVYNTFSSNFFQEFKPDNSTYYLIITFTGIDRELPSFEILGKLGIDRKYFYYLDNCLCLSFGCFSNPPNLLDLVLELQLNPYDKFETCNLKNKLESLYKFQEIFFLLRNNIDAMYRLYESEERPNWLDESLKKLQHLGIHNIKDARDRYVSIMNYQNIGSLITNELNNLQLNKYWIERNYIS